MRRMLTCITFCGMLFGSRAYAGESCFGLTYKPIDDVSYAASNDGHTGVMILPSPTYLDCMYSDAASAVDTPCTGPAHTRPRDFNLLSLNQIRVQMTNPDDPNHEKGVYRAKRLTLSIDLTRATLPEFQDKRPSSEDEYYSSKEILCATVYCALLAISPPTETPVTVEIKYPEGKSQDSWKIIERTYHWLPKKLAVREGDIGGCLLKRTDFGGFDCCPKMPRLRN